MTSEWARDLVESKKQELEEKRLNDEKDLSDRNLLDAHFVVMCPEVVDAAEKAVEELNQGMKKNCIDFYRESDNSKFILRVHTHSIDVRFDRRTCAIHSECGAYTLTVIEGNRVVWQSQERTPRRIVSYTSEQVAREEVRKAFEMVRR